jgi:chemotaxis response regulator CheB
MIKILIVDDSAVARDTIAEVLRHDQEFKIVGYAEDGLQAVNLCGVLKPDLILMDIHMPKMNGLQAIQAIMKSRNPVPSVVLTTDYTSKTVRHAMRVGGQEAMEKPSLDWSFSQMSTFFSLLKNIAADSMPRFMD